MRLQRLLIYMIPYHYHGLLLLLLLYEVHEMKEFKGRKKLRP